jgi:hypothetical protein
MIQRGTMNVLFAGLALGMMYLASPPFVLSLSHMLGYDWMHIRDTLYLPIVLVAMQFPVINHGYEAYCRLVIEVLRLPTP